MGNSDHGTTYTLTETQSQFSSSRTSPRVRMPSSNPMVELQCYPSAAKILLELFPPQSVILAKTYLKRVS